jgi:hypothetical protein
MSYQEKYLKYKKKYLELKKLQNKNMQGGFFGFKLSQENMTETGLPDVLSPLDSDTEMQNNQNNMNNMNNMNNYQQPTEAPISQPPMEIPTPTSQTPEIPTPTSQTPEIPTPTSQPQAEVPLPTSQPPNDVVNTNQSGGLFGFKIGIENMTDNQLPEVLSPLQSELEPQGQSFEQQQGHPLEQSMNGGKRKWLEDSDLEISSITDLSSEDSLSDFGL